MIFKSQQQIAEVFGVSRETIDAWQKLGMPVEVRGSPGNPSTFDSAKCIEWKIQREIHKVSGEKPQNWLAREQALSKQMDNAVRRGELIPAAELEPKLRAAFVAAREYWRNEPTRLARDVSGKPVEEVEELLAAAFDAFLVKLAAWPSQLATTDALEDPAAAHSNASPTS